MASDTVVILALEGSTDLFEQLNVALMAYLTRSAKVLRVTTIEAALTTLASPSLTSVLVADSAVIEARFKKVSAALARNISELNGD
ncbi:hypothetical protein FRC05_010573 [Tulasnella sp. 425]|nr:hypothetical protein FRC05_010573 [Tulasnella sp. 425]